MALKGDGRYTRRHLAEFLILAIFSFVALNRLYLSLESFLTAMIPEVIKVYILALRGFAPTDIVVLKALQIIIAPIPPFLLWLQAATLLGTYMKPEHCPRDFNPSDL